MSQAPPPLDRFDLYELCAQDPARQVRFLRAAHAHGPRILGEDFSATAAVARAWVASAPRALAVAVDHDSEPLARAGEHPRLRKIVADVRAVHDTADVIATLNFSLGEFHDRPPLVAYLAHARSRLRRHGVFVADLYGGIAGVAPARVERRLRGPHGERIVYTWDQGAVDPLTGRVENAMHFRVERPPGRPGRARILRRAFVYRWRLWSIPELRDAMTDAGFRAVEVHDRLGAALDHEGNLHLRPVEDATELDDDFVVCLVARR